MKVLIIGTLPSSLYNFRGALIESIVSNNHFVVCAASGATESERVRILGYANDYYDYKVARSGLNPFSDLITFYHLIRILNKEKPDVVISYTIKPVIWTGIACFLFKNVKFFPMITGLGYAFSPGNFLKNLLKLVASALYRVSLKRSQLVFFQNEDNKKCFVELGIIPSCKTVVVNGSGVDFSRFSKSDVPKCKHFLMIARLLKDKGVFEFLEAAKLVKTVHPDATFTLVGPLDPSPNAVPLSVISDAASRGLIDYKGECDDVRPYLHKASVYVLPSYHEGMPRTVLEAMATGRPIITTNAPGCRDTVLDYVNGRVVPVGDSHALADAMYWFIENLDLLQVLGDSSYQIAMSKYDVNMVNGEILRSTGLLNETPL